MNNKLSTTYLVLIIASMVFGCREPKVENEIASASAISSVNGEKYSIDTKESVISWKGTMVIGKNGHTGFVTISKGTLLIDNGQLVGGTAEIDMSTIEDNSHKSNSGLIQHLKDTDFFDVKKFPIATIAIAKAAPENAGNINVTGNLTIKGFTHLVSFPAKIDIKDGIVNANGKMMIDRTDYGIFYQSGKYFDVLAEKAMSDSIEFNIKIVAKK